MDIVQAVVFLVALSTVVVRRTISNNFSIFVPNALELKQS